ncbi:MAG: AbrB/MazE/SpoVT family DNA-binding domain-containing protein [bacterium]
MKRHMPKIIEKTTVTSKGQITIPKKYRDMLKLKSKDTVTFRIKQDLIEVIPFTSNIAKYFGKVKPKDKPEEFKKIRKEFEETVAGGIKK